MTKKEFENLEVDKTFNLGYRKFKVVESDYGCNDCFFDEVCEHCRQMTRNNFIPECYSENRKDEKDVIFIEVEE